MHVRDVMKDEKHIIRESYLT